MNHAQLEHLKFTKKVHWGKQRIVRNNILPLIKGQTVLDFGCGTGGYTKMLAGVAKFVVGYDTDEAKLAIAKKENSALNIVYTSKFPKEYYDAATFLSVLEYIPDWYFEYTQVKSSNKFVICPDFRGKFHFSFFKFNFDKPKEWAKKSNRNFNDEFRALASPYKVLHFSNDFGLGKNNYLYYA